MDLNSPISDLPKVGPILEKKLKKLGINTIQDLFYHAPSRYVDFSTIVSIGKIQVGETVTVHAKIVSIINQFTKRGARMQIASVEDDTGKMTVVWFNQPFLTRMLYPGRLVSLSGKVEWFNRKPALFSPEYEIMEEEDGPTVHTGRLVPVYPETMGLSSKWIRTLIKRSFEDNELKFDEFLPKEVLTGGTLVSLKEAVQKVHFPKSEKETEVGRKRLAFNEMLLLNLKSLSRKNLWKKNHTANKLNINKSEVDAFIKSLPFDLTPSQEKVSDEILSDLSKDIPMNRLLEGDVGSGKTVVAAIGALAAFTNGKQSIFMAPTQILAEQHYKTLTQLFKNYKIRISLLTGSVKKSEIGSTDLFVGTHSLIHSKIDFSKVAFVVIDEQHRFGVEQRAHLVKKSGTPHVLTMTATPIPRTIALTTYGDLELSVLTEMPKSRQKVTTWFVPNTKRKAAYEWINKQISKSANDKPQAFIVCPLIEESEKETMEGVRAVTQEFEKLKSIFAGLKLGLLHGRLKVKEKNEILDKFRAGKINILVATPVVEVGIDIPNATIMVIEAAERFGLAQLHQLRGRVGRGIKKSYCLLFANIKYSKRLKAMEKMHSGFELAELDLKLRGPGEIFGTAQSGFAELKIASWSDYELIKETKEIAEDVIKNPKKYPLLTSTLQASPSLG
jgi:ATP-dependent DNA helicase RecG